MAENNDTGKFNHKIASPSDYLKLYRTMLELIFEHEGHISEKQRNILNKKIEDWNLCPVDAKKLEKETGKLYILQKSVMEEIRLIVDKARGKGYLSEELTNFSGEGYSVGNVLDSASEDSVTWVSKGLELLQQGKYEEAIQCYDKALAISPQDSHAWTKKGLAFIVQGKYEEAISCFERALEYDVEDANIWAYKGDALLNTGKYKEAMLCCDHALELDPELLFAWDRKGDVLRENGKYKEAIECYDKLLELDPSYSVWGKKGKVMEKLGKKEEALKCYRMASFNKEDIKYVCMRTKVTEEEARKALLENKGDVVEAIISIKRQKRGKKT